MQAKLMLFGRYQLLVDGASAKFATEHSRALLAYLAVQPGAHERTKLATLLWPEQPEATARHNLRQTLFSLKQTLQHFPQLEAYLAVTSKSIELQPTGMSVDVQHFRQLWAACAVHTHPQLAACDECVARLQQAADLYTGEFLQGVDVKNSILFEEWTLLIREELHRQMLEILDTLTLHNELTADYAHMQHNARRQLELEPWREEAHRQLMRALALSGQGTAALAHYAASRRTLDEELGVPPSAATTALYEQIKRGEFDREMQRGGKAGREKESEGNYHPSILPPHNLPALSTLFVGREQEVEEITHSLADPDTRLLTLVGPGGMGKTRLAIEAAHKLTALRISDPLRISDSSTNFSFDDGLFFVSLAPLSSSDGLAQAIAATLGLDLHSDPHQTVINYLCDKSLLLVLDNFEHLLDGVPLIIEILAQASHVRVMATSRERLNVRGEQLYPVPPLIHLPQGELAEATTWSAVRLFVERARRVMPNFKLTEQNLPALLRICGLVQGMPLGLEMAAAWCNALSLDEIAAEIERNIDFLAVDYHDLPERQRSMRAVLAWSWRLLSEDEARLLRQLAVFSGGFTRQAAETICGASLRELNGLVNKSLLRRSLDDREKPGTSTGRYELHVLMCQFAQEQLRVLPDEWTKSMGRHSEFYLAFVAERERRLMRHESREAMNEIQAELDNVRQAWTWAANHCAGAALDRSAYGLWQFYLLAGLAAEGVQAFRQATTALQRSLADKPVESSVQSQQHILSKLWVLSAHLLCGHGSYDESIDAAQRAIALANGGGPDGASQIGTALGYLVLGQALYHQSVFNESQMHNERALQAALAAQREMTPDEVWSEIEVQARLFLSAIARIYGDYARAKSHLADCLRLCQQLGKLRGEVHAQLNLGYTAWLAREPWSARQAYEQVLPLTTALRYRWGEGVARYELSLVVRGLGEYSLALSLCRQALPLFVEINERQKQVHVLSDLIELYAFLGQFERADRYLADQATLLRQIKAPDAERVALVANVILAQCRGDNDQALVAAQQLWQLVRSANSSIYHAEALTLLGQAHSGLHQYRAATDSYIQALTLYQAFGVYSEAAEAQIGLAGIALAQGDHIQAQQLTETVLTMLEQLPHVGVFEPFPLYLTCYRVLAATHDPRARLLLQRAYTLLQSYAANIHDETLRASFLQNVSVHRQLMLAYEEIYEAAYEKE